MALTRTQIDAIITKMQGSRDLSPGGVLALKEVLHGLNDELLDLDDAPVLLGSADTAFPDGLVLTAGTNITLTPGAGTLTVAASGGGGGNSVAVAVNFGATFSHFAETVVIGETWVTAFSEIVVTPLAVAGSSPIENPLFQFSPSVSDRVAGTGFTLSVYTPVRAKGSYIFSCVGV